MIRFGVVHYAIIRGAESPYLHQKKKHPRTWVLFLLVDGTYERTNAKHLFVGAGDLKIKSTCGARLVQIIREFYQ